MAKRIDEPIGSLAVLGPVEFPAATPEDIKAEAKRVLAEGDYLAARALVARGLESFPESILLRDFANLIAPPRIIGRSPAIVDGSIAANQRWLLEHHDAFSGQWVCLKGGTLVASSDDYQTLEKLSGGFAGLFVTRVF